MGKIYVKIQGIRCPFLGAPMRAARRCSGVCVFGAVVQNVKTY